MPTIFSLSIAGLVIIARGMGGRVPGGVDRRVLAAKRPIAGLAPPNINGLFEQILNKFGKAAKNIYLVQS